MSVFSNIQPQDRLFENNDFIAIYDNYPVSEGHILIISKREIETFFDLLYMECESLCNCIYEAKQFIEKFYAPTGYNIGMNCGKSAGQTVMHFHCHVIPRYDGDMDDPRGGIRHCIKGKGYY